MIKKRLPLRCIQRAFMSIKSLPHHSIQRTFLLWYNENHTHFKVPIRLTRITAKGVKFHFHNYPDCLYGLLSSRSIRVSVEWHGQLRDTLIDYDVSPYKTLGGYKCKQCVYEKGESATLFSSSEALWLDHLFATFLKWVNEKLAPASWLRISCTDDRGATWAKLILDERELSKPDRTLLLMQQLKRVDGEPCYEGGPEDVTNWLIPLKPEAN